MATQLKEEGRLCTCFKCLQPCPLWYCKCKLSAHPFGIAAAERERRLNYKCVKTRILPPWMCLYRQRSEEAGVDEGSEEPDVAESEVEDSEEEDSG
jgi:hypothetical protein